RRQVVEMKCCRLFGWAHNPKVGGSNPPPATNLISLNRKGQRSFRWPFLLFIPCSTVQNSSEFVGNSALVCSNGVCISHCGLRLSMSQTILPNGHRGTEPIK